MNLPSQRQPPGFDSAVRVIISRGAKFNELIRQGIRARKDLLYAFVELLGKRCQIFGGVEFGILQLVWLRVE